MREVHLINNRSVFGGGLHILRSPVLVEGAIFTGNEAANLGGALYKALGISEFRNTLIAGNQAENGGGVYGFRALSSFVNSQFSGNLATQDGGAYYFDTHRISIRRGC